ncbi:MAG TPA: hypothetical protein VHO03_16120 [Ignavibacteriales bacterium]|nr:hypothetical protein [Ignavibacteriales bacterium]
MNCKKSKIFFFLAALLVIFSSRASAQFSFYGNTSFGYNENPLYNYQKKPDQLRQSYLEMNYLKEFTSSNLSFSYVSGLTLFNQLSDRNYYEHNLFARYNLRLTEKKIPAKEVSESNSENSEDSTSSSGDVETSPEEDEDSYESALLDSSASYIGFTAILGARHDKTAFKEFDNFGSGLTVYYKTVPADAFQLRITNSLGLRNYAYITELSNLTDQLHIQIASKYNGSFQYGLSLSGGIKYYTTSVYDTTKFETKRSFNQKSQGKGKLGSKISVPSDKKILLEPQENGTTQYTAGLFFNKSWQGATRLKTSFLYRYNPKTLTRYLAQYANTSMLSEDLYNDFFSYQGVETKIALDQPLPWSMQMSVEYSFQKKNFEAPALNLEGVQINNEKRSDLTNSLELYVSKGFTLFERLNLDLMLGTGIVRNQSNDDYNDFSSYQLSGTIGIGF